MKTLTAFAAAHGIELAALEAVLEVEANGAAFSDVVALDGRRCPVLRGPEVHLLWKACTPAGRALLDAYFRVTGPKPWQGHKYRPTLSSEWLDLHTGQVREWEALWRAHSTVGAPALEASSFGMGQVLGMHWHRLGYDSVYDQLAAQWTAEGQVDTFLRFVGADARLVASLVKQDWQAFATVYNGSGQVLDYAKRLATAYAVAYKAKA